MDNTIKPIGMIYGRTSISSVQAIKIIDSDKVEMGMLVRMEPIKGFNVLGRVFSIWTKNRLLDNEDALPNLKTQDLIDDHSITNLGIAKDIAQTISFEVIIIGCKDQDIFIRPRFPITPGQLIYRADDDFVRQFFNESSTIEIGKLRDNPTVGAFLDYNKLITYHFSILAMTGAGKSYCAGVIIEQICQLNNFNLPIIILDPHSEYSSLIIPNEKNMENPNAKKIAESVSIFCPGEINYNMEKKFENHFSKKRPTEAIKFHPADLTTEQLKTLLSQYYGLTQAQSRGLDNGWDPIHFEAESGNPPSSIDSMLSRAVEHIEHKGTKTATESKLRALFNRTFFDMNSKINWAKFIKKGRISIIDLSSINDFDQQAIVGLILRKLFELRRSEKISPFLCLIEEAHNFIPSSQENSSSKSTIARIAAEGRKFGIGLCVISQRPSKLDSDVLSQCNTHIILRLMNPKDQKFVQDISEYMTKEDSESIRGLANGEAMVIGYAVPFPILCRIKERIMRHGGITPNLKDSLQSSP